MHDLSVADCHVFEQWLEEEKIYLRGLQKELEEETLHMEYWQKLRSIFVAVSKHKLCRCYPH